MNACIRTTPEQRMGEEAVWTMESQLLALLIEVVSIKVANQQIKKPIDIPRPGKKGSKRKRIADAGQREVERRREQAANEQYEYDENQQDQQDQPREMRRQPPPPSRRASSTDDAYQQGIATLMKTSRPRN